MNEDGIRTPSRRYITTAVHDTRPPGPGETKPNSRLPFPKNTPPRPDQQPPPTQPAVRAKRYRDRRAQAADAAQAYYKRR